MLDLNTGAARTLVNHYLKKKLTGHKISMVIKAVLLGVKRKKKIQDNAQHFNSSMNNSMSIIKAVGNNSSSTKCVEK